MRKILIALAAVLVLVIGGVVFLASNLDGLVKTAIEQVGSKVAGVKVSVAKVAISIKDGKGSIEGLTVDNPPGFKTPHAISLGAIAVELDTASVTKSPVIIKTISIAAPEVSYEVSGQGSNIDALKKNVDGFVAANAPHNAADKPAAEPAKKDTADATKLVIDLLSITGGKVTLATPIPGAAATAKLGDITLKDIGKSKGGASPADVATQVLDVLSSSAIKSASSALSVGNVTDMAKGAVGGAMSQVKGLLGK